MQLDLHDQTQVYLGLYERELQRWVRLFCRHAVTAVDVGASDGMYALYFLLRTNARKVYAFEPDLLAWEQLMANLRLNGVAGDPRLEVSASAVGQAGHGNVLALDSLLTSIERPAVVKVDVEGAELQVLEGATQLLREGGISWIIETHSAELELACSRVLERGGLQVRVVAPAWWRIVVPETRPMPHNRWLVAHETAGDIT